MGMMQNYLGVFKIIYYFLQHMMIVLIILLINVYAQNAEK